MWINEREAEVLPKEVVNLNFKNFEIKYLKGRDLKSYKKIIPSLINFPESIIVTCDDDVVYYSNWLWDLYRNSLDSNHLKIICHRARLITFDKSFEVANYLDWPLLGPFDDMSSLKVFPNGIGGILYPPNCFFKDVLNQEIFMRLCETTDDIWLYFMSSILGVEKRKIPSNFTNIVVHEGSKESALWNINQINNHNNDQLLNLITLYKNNGQFDFIGTLRNLS